MPAVLEIPIELAVLGLRLLLVLALYAFLAMVLRDIHRNWNQNASREDVALRLIVTSSGSDAVRVGQQFEVHQRCTIGRRTELAVSLDDGHLSARHAELAPRAGTWFLRDLGSTNGTRLNGAPVESELRVAPGDFIELGSVTLQIAKSS